MINTDAKKNTALVTGGGRGIGRAIAVRLAAGGCNVAINYSKSAKGAKETAEACRMLGAKTLLLQGNVADSEDCRRMAAETEAWGNGIDILVNNAGITADDLLIRMTMDEFQRVIDVNLTGTFNMMQACARGMIRRRGGRIINIASVVGVMGNSGQVNYAASKAGIIGMTKSFAREVAGRNITVNAVAPGFIATDMTAAMTERAAETVLQKIPQQRMGKPEDVAEAVQFFASEGAGYVTGQVLCVDGGMCM